MASETEGFPLSKSSPDLSPEMDISSLDQNSGSLFASKVRSLFGSPVAAPSPDDAGSFWFRASF